jgi:hypothetical protein
MAMRKPDGRDRSLGADTLLQYDRAIDLIILSLSYDTSDYNERVSNLKDFPMNTFQTGMIVISP